MRFAPTAACATARRPSDPDTAVLLCNLGTPDAPTAPALRRYLAEFLSDPRVVEIPRALWWLILHGIILRVRPAKSAAKYASIWTPDGSPLRVWTDKQATLLQAAWASAATGAGALRHALRPARHRRRSWTRSRREGATRMLMLPAYPQYSGATTASVIDDGVAGRCRPATCPSCASSTAITTTPATSPPWPRACASTGSATAAADKLVMSFHGMPERTLHLGDPYHCECQKTGRLLAEAPGPEGRRHGWSPSRAASARPSGCSPTPSPPSSSWPRRGAKRVDVVCPGFASRLPGDAGRDRQEARDASWPRAASDFRYIPCLNDQPGRIAALAEAGRAPSAGLADGSAATRTPAGTLQRLTCAGAAGAKQ